MKKEIIIVIVVLAIGAYFLFGKKKEEAITINNDVIDDEEEEEDEIEHILGCTDSSACNEKPDATLDDGSCFYPDECGVCEGGGIPDGDCDCNGAVLDVCNVCGGGDTDVNECGGGVGEENQMVFEGRVYSTQIVEYANGSQLEWMTENFRYVNSYYYFTTPPNSSNSAFGLYSWEDVPLGEIEENAYFQKYGILYNHNFILQNNHTPDGWRLPSPEEFEGLLSIPNNLGTLFTINDLCSVDNWANEGGTNESGMNFKAGGRNTGSSATGLYQTGRALYLVEKNGNQRRNISFGNTDTDFTVYNSNNICSVRLVRVPAP